MYLIIIKAYGSGNVRLFNIFFLLQLTINTEVYYTVQIYINI